MIGARGTSGTTATGLGSLGSGGVGIVGGRGGGTGAGGSGMGGSVGAGGMVGGRGTSAVSLMIGLSSLEVWQRGVARDRHADSPAFRAHCNRCDAKRRMYRRHRPQSICDVPPPTLYRAGEAAHCIVDVH